MPAAGHSFLVVSVLLAAVLAGYAGDQEQSSSAWPAPVSTGEPSQVRAATSDEPMSQLQRDKFSRFMDKVELRRRVGHKFELIAVHYTSATDAVATFLTDHSVPWERSGHMIAVTDDNWAHASRLYISNELADLIDYVPLGRGAVAIKATDQFPRRWFPPFVLYPSGRIKPLEVGGPRAFDVDGRGWKISSYNLFSPVGAGESAGVWSFDFAAGEVFPVPGSPEGDVWQQVPGREGQLLSVGGYRRKIGDGVWRFASSIDNGRSWRRTDVALPLGDKSLPYYSDVTWHAVGHRPMHAIAMADAPEDMPYVFRELWRTDDEEQFHRVPLKWGRVFFGGLAFAADGALLLAEVQGPDTWCGEGPACERPGRIWRLAPDSSEPTLLRDAPSLYGPFWAVGIQASGGVIIARTGLRTIAVSKNGYTWTDVTPG